MNGECKSYRLNDPMQWDDFKSMPDDLKVVYVNALRKKYSVPDSKMCEAWGVNKDKVSRLFKKLGLSDGKTRKIVNWDKDGFYAWWNGVERPTAPVPECPDKEEVFMEDDLPFEEPEEPIVVDVMADMEKQEHLIVEHYRVMERYPQIVPECGNMEFTGKVESIQEALRVLLGGANVRMRVSWEVIPEEGGLCNGQA